MCRGGNYKSRDLVLRFELPETAVWGNLLAFGLCDFKSLAVCDLRVGALGSNLGAKNNLCQNKFVLMPPTQVTLTRYQPLIEEKKVGKGERTGEPVKTRGREGRNRKKRDFIA